MTELQRRIDFCLRNPHMWNHCDDVKKALAEAGDVLHNLHGQIRDYDRQQKERDAALAAKDAEIARLEAKIDEWKDASMLIDSGGDPSGIEPRDLEKELQDRDAEIAELRRAQSVVLKALQYAYRKHVLLDDNIGWNELGDWLWDAICNIMDNEPAIDWLAKAREGKGGR